MTQQDRDWLFNESYRLDNLSRLWLTQEVRDGLKIVSVERVERLRIQEKTDNLCVVFSERELCLVAESLRELAAKDEARVLSNDRKRNYR